MHLQMRIESLEKEIRDLQRSIKWRRNKTAAFGHDALRKAEQQYAKVVEILRRRLENIRKRAAEARDFSDQLKNKINECRKTRKIYLGEIEDTRAALERLRYEKRTWEDFEEEKRLALAVLKRQSLILEEAAKAKRAKYQQRYLATVNAIEKLDGATGLSSHQRSHRRNESDDAFAARKGGITESHAASIRAQLQNNAVQAKIAQQATQRREARLRMFKSAFERVKSISNGEVTSLQSLVTFIELRAANNLALSKQVQQYQAENRSMKETIAATKSEHHALRKRLAAEMNREKREIERIQREEKTAREKIDRHEQESAQIDSENKDTLAMLAKLLKMLGDDDGVEKNADGEASSGIVDAHATTISKQVANMESIFADIDRLSTEVSSAPLAILPMQTTQKF